MYMYVHTIPMISKSNKVYCTCVREVNWATQLSGEIDESMNSHTYNGWQNVRDDIPPYWPIESQR